ncbi:hypothetical protein [Tenggerimyces flavus]|uniref:Uncharacterized protein n=1 Tax=Tenggerimyces flavus TaxID=1708749 RepID=A0ABV7Y4B4_9ACTN|nr:hypothetical protein [Tenggerimyces flavus]MBM7788324.1 hypothetical protein [Tenggerimyces flavus]
MKDFLQIIGVIIAVPQGLVPIILNVLDKNLSGWQLVSHLPEGLQIGASIGALIIGGLLLLLGDAVGKKRRASAA